VAVSAGPAVHHLRVFGHIGAFGRFLSLGASVNHWWRIWLFWPGANSLERVEVDLVLVLSSHSLPGEHPVASVFVVALTGNGARNFAENFGPISALNLTSHTAIFRRNGAHGVQTGTGLNFFHGAGFARRHGDRPLAFAAHGPVKTALGEITWCADRGTSRSVTIDDGVQRVLRLSTNRPGIMHVRSILI